MISDKKIGRIISESIHKVINEGFEDNSSLEDVVMKLYRFGVELNTNNEYRNISINGIGSIIMESCRKIMELYNKKDMRSDFSNEFTRMTSKKNGGK